jgi:hypothetical protein
VNQLKTAFWLVLLTVLLVLIGRLTFGVAGMYAFLGLALIMNGSATGSATGSPWRPHRREKRDRRRRG